MEMRANVLDRLRNRYGSNRVQEEPSLKGTKTVYPDVAVFFTSDCETPFLLVECSSFRTSHRKSRDLDEVSEAVAATEAKYGALVGPNAEFVFSGSGPEYTSYSDFPPIDQEYDDQPRPIRSQTELDFLVERALSAQRSVQDRPQKEVEAIDALFESLHLLLEARRVGISLGMDVGEQAVTELRGSLSSRHQGYRPNKKHDPQHLRVVSLLFNGFSLSRTEDHILESLFELTTEDKRGGEYSTPLDVARQMVRLTAPSDGDVVLDPAAGRGTILSLAAEQGAHGVGIELNASIVSLATFYIDLFDRDVEITPGDFFEAEEGSARLPSSVDHVIVDPPFNADIDHEDIPFADGRGRIYSQDAFLAKGLTLLEEEGRLTIAVPAEFLYNRRSRWIRETILQQFQLDSIIQIVDGPIYRYTSIDTAILTISNRSPLTDHAVNYEIIESPDDSTDALAEAVSAISTGESESILQSDLDDSLNIRMLTERESLRERLSETFKHITELSSVADLRTGGRPEGVVEDPSEDTIRYLSIGDVREGKSRQQDRYISREEATTIVDQSSVLLSTIGTDVLTYIPSEALVPDQQWAVLDFDSPEEALVYEAFLKSDLGTKQLNALKSGSTIKRVNLRDLREVFVPQFTDDEITERARAVRERQKEIERLEAERERLEREQEELVDDVTDLLSGGESNE
jgi:tRNA G10  N-methylase Trm11